MIKGILLALLFSNAVSANDECSQRYEAAYQAYMNRDPGVTTYRDQGRIVREANRATNGGREMTETARRMAARSFAERERQRCERESSE